MIHLSGTRFGDLSIGDDAVISFPDGLIGFSHEKRFALIERPNGHIAYLQSLTTPHLALPVVDASVLRPAYPAIGVDKLAELSGARPEHMAILVVVAVDPEGQLRANLLAPVVTDVDSRVGRQIILEGTSYGANTPIGGKKPSKPVSGKPSSATNAASADR
jgi:flagellar assembly factor FliW